MILKNNVSIITGGATGIGRATVETFAKEGAKVVFCDINKKQGLKNQNDFKKMGLDTFFINADVSNENNVKKLINFVIKKFNKIDTLFNNAGIEQVVTPSHEVDVKIFESTIPFIYDYDKKDGKSKILILHSVLEYFRLIVYLKMISKKICGKELGKKTRNIAK